jgi:hypothetical protein
MAKPSIRFSASRSKEVSSCSWIFYVKEYLKVPDSVHNKTVIGSFLHAIMESIMLRTRPKRVAMFKDMLKNGASFKMYPQFIRYAKMYDAKFGMAPYDVNELESMLEVALLGLRPHFIDVKGEFNPPEYYNEMEFNIKIGDAHLKGFIDVLIVYPDRIEIQDFKSQGKVFAKEELTNNIQAAVYELAVWKMFKKPSSVTFILLRHPPTKRTPNKHLQVFGQKDETFFSGLEEYIKFGHSYMNNFGIQEATLNFKADHDKGFCLRVCQFRQSVDYVVELDKDGDPVKGFFPEDTPDKVPNGHRLEARRYNGCLRFGGTIPI